MSSNNFDSEDLYEVLGASKSYDDRKLKKAYHKLAIKWHPDKHDGNDKKKAEDIFKKLTYAYSILGDKEKRANYDRYGRAFFEQGGGGGGAE